MITRKLAATVGAIATAIACTLVAAPVVSAAPALECGLCWGSPKAADVVPANVTAHVGSGVSAIRL